MRIGVGGRGLSALENFTSQFIKGSQDFIFSINLLLMLRVVLELLGEGIELKFDIGNSLLEAALLLLQGGELGSELSKLVGGLAGESRR